MALRGTSARFPWARRFRPALTAATRVRAAAEIRPENTTANKNRGSRANANKRADWAGFNRVDGDFAGTTDELIQWAACKWGIDEDIVRAQIVKESTWYQSAVGDGGESFGVGQVRNTAHREAFEYSVNAQTSTAYNLDYTYAVWRACYEGVFTWLNNVERNGTYAAGDVWGCIGVWFSGRWYFNNDAYLNRKRTGGVVGRRRQVALQQQDVADALLHQRLTPDDQSIALANSSATF